MGLLDWLFGKRRCPYCGSENARKGGARVRCPNPQCRYFDPSLRSSGLSGDTSSCPECGSKASLKAGVVHCSNPSCRCFDATIGRQGALRQAGVSLGRVGTFVPAKPVSIRYRNFREQQRTFVAEADTIQRRRNHVVARVVPTGENITLSRARILNLEEVESVLPKRVAPGQPWPTPRERQVLNYHKKYGTSSPLYEKIRAKYPDW
jgi:hypothetical protein